MTPKAQLAERAIYHITHVENLPSILQEGGLWSDAQRIQRDLNSKNIGHRHIKQRRLLRPVNTKANGKLGEYIPFNFCPRSVILYAVHRGHQDYCDGQAPIVHLVSTVTLATSMGQPWAFSDRHAELAHALHFDDLTMLCHVPWQVMDKTYWVEVREERQAEFLVHDFFPWTGITLVAAMTQETVQRAKQCLLDAGQNTPVVLKPQWYY